MNHLKLSRKKAIFALIIFFLIVDVGIFLKYRADERYLLNLSQQVVSSQDLPSEKTMNLLKYIRQEIPSNPNPSSFLLPIFRPLRPTARQVAETSGDCADKARLLIRLLQLNQVHASKVALYDAQQMPQHAVVQVNIENDQEMVVDALYGMYFPKEDEEYYSLDDLKNDKTILQNRVKTLITQGEDYDPPLSKYRFDDYTYAHPRTINWDKSLAFKISYRVIGFFIGEQVDKIKRPYFVESPALMLLYATVSVQVTIIIGIVIFAKLSPIGTKIPVREKHIDS